jgi:hypothetical protein
VIAQPSPIQFDRSTGVPEGANAWERPAAFAFSSGSKVSSTFSQRGYSSYDVFGTASAFWQSRIQAPERERCPSRAMRD